MKTQKHMGHYFKAVDIRLEHHMNLRLQALDLTSAQGHIIGFLAHSKTVPCARDVERFFGLSHPTVSGLLNRMEAKGFVEICPDPQDRRVKRIVLLDKGLACSRQIEHCIEENEQMMTRGFTPEEIDQFRRMLQRVIANMRVTADSSPTNREE